MSNFQDKIDSLSYLYSPTSVKDFKKEINKLVEVLKEFPQLASPKDVQNIQDVVYKNYQKITYKVEGGFANTNYTISFVTLSQPKGSIVAKLKTQFS